MIDAAPGAAGAAPEAVSALPVTLDRGSAPGHPLRTGRRGERFVAWSALVVLAIAAMLFVQRIGDLRDEQIRAEAARSVASSANRTRAAGAPPPDLAAIAGAELLPDAASGPGAPTAPEAAERAAESKVSSSRAHRPPAVPISAVRKPPRAAGSRASPPSPAPARLADAQVDEPAAEPSRWERMREEIALCATDGFFAKMVCELDVRTRYCSGWWGSADECPSGRTADYGN